MPPHTSFCNRCLSSTLKCLCVCVCVQHTGVYYVCVNMCFSLVYSTWKQNWKESTVSLRKHSSSYLKNSPMHIKTERRRQEQMFCLAPSFCCWTTRTSSHIFLPSQSVFSLFLPLSPLFKNSISFLSLSNLFSYFVAFQNVMLIFGSPTQKQTFGNITLYYAFLPFCLL